jgi:hypothetical protein
MLLFGSAFQTREDPATKQHRPVFSLTLPVPLYLLAHLVGRYQFPSTVKESPVPPEEMHRWHENDGICPVFSQYHPHDCSPDYCTHRQGMPIANAETREDSAPSPVPGKWQVWELSDTSHFGLIPVWRNTEKQQQFFLYYRNYLLKIESKSFGAF